MKQMTLRALFGALLFSLPLSASQSLLVTETSPSVLGLGRGYDLLDSSTPFGRTYSGASGLKGKTEIGFSTIILPDSFSVQSLSFTLGRPVVSGLRLGGYLTFLSIGAFNELDVKGSFVKNLESSDLLFGASALWDPQSAKVGKLPKVLQTALTHTSAGLNVNVYRSAFDATTTAAFLVDFNVAARGAVPQLGQARRLMTVEDLERQKKELKAGLERAKAEKKPNPVELATREKLYGDFEVLAASRAKDLAEVAASRADIYRIYNDATVDLTLPDAQGFYARAMDDLTNLHGESVDISRDSAKTVAALLEEAHARVGADLAKYAAELTNGGGVAASETTALLASFKAYLEKDFETTPLSEIRDPFIKGTKETLTGVADTWATLAKKAYSRDDMATNLKAWNEDAQTMAGVTNKTPFVSGVTNKLPRGMKVKIPDLAYFEAARARDEKQARLKHQRAGFMELTVGSNETWASIARDHIGSANLVKELLSANRRTSEKPQVQPGEKVRVPLLLDQNKRVDREKKFLAEVATRKANVGKGKVSESVATLWEGLTSKIQETLDLYAIESKGDADRGASLLALANVLNQESTGLSREAVRTLRELEKIQLRRKLDLVNANNEKSRAEASREYKTRERAIFKGMLALLSSAKERMIKELDGQGGRSADDRVAGAKRLGKLQASADDRERRLETIRAGKDTKAQAEVKAKSDAQAKGQATAYSERLAQIEGERKSASERLAWRTYLTEMIYRGGGEARDTLALGVAVRNLGTELNYGLIAEAPPTAVSVDLNYEFMHLERHDLLLYGHFDYSTIAANGFGGGLAYRYMKRFEARVGALSENDQLVVAANLSALIELGLMNYRIDFGAQYRPAFGPTIQFGLGIVF